MKFILNTSFTPYFCALFDTKGRLVQKKQWEAGKTAGKIVWDFCKQQNLKHQPIDFIGAISGPGGFSQLRTGSVIIQTLSFYFQLPIHQARADLVIKNFLSKHQQPNESFVLNSFGSGVFLVQENKLIRYDNPDSIPKELKNRPLWVKLLPKEKQNHFIQKIELSTEGIEFSTLETLAQQTPSYCFVPDYEYPAVQKNK